MIDLVIPGDPQSYERTTRSWTTGKAIDRGGFRTWKRHARATIIRELRDQGLRGLARPVRVEVDAVFRRPERCPDGIPAAVWALGGRLVRPGTQDVDNIEKAIFDALQPSKRHREQGAPNVYPLADDRWIVLSAGGKWYAAVDEGAHVRVRIVPVRWDGVAEVSCG